VGIMHGKTLSRGYGYDIWEISQLNIE
jgi:hypothetical protein